MFTGGLVCALILIVARIVVGFCCCIGGFCRLVWGFGLVVLCSLRWLRCVCLISCLLVLVVVMLGTLSCGSGCVFISLCYFRLVSVCSWLLVV